MSDIKNAIVLAAGLGSRLKPLTDEIPKCLTEINGQPMLLQTLGFLEKYGIKRTVIVIGYFGQVIRDYVGDRIGNMTIEYVKNDIYDETNSSYSLWLAKDYLKEGSLVIEGDTIYDEAIIEKTLKTGDSKSYWVVDKFTSDRDGSMSITDNKNRIVKLKIIRQRLKEYKSNYYKSTGLLKLNSKYGDALATWLDTEVKADNVKIYYDLVIEKHLADIPIYVFNIHGLRWEEIDNFEDLRKAENLFMSMKHLIIVLDGAADNPQERLNDKTPLESARIPTIDFMAKNGRAGLMKTMLSGLPIGSIVANMGILGYNPMRYYPNGRASFEAIAQDIYLSDDDIAFRCNLVSIKDEILTDFTAGNISSETAEKIIKEIKNEFKDIEIYPGQSYRNLVIVRNAGIPVSDIRCYEPHMNIGTPVGELRIKSLSSEANNIVERLNNFIKESRSIIKRVNKELSSHADSLFIWSPSSMPRMPSFHKKFGYDGAIVTAMDFLGGIAKATRMEHNRIPGATGYSDTDLNAKLSQTLRYLENNDVIFVHINAPDEESHINNLEGKVEIIERIDRELITPLIDFLNKKYPNNFRISILPDHYTYVRDGKHDDKLVPYVLYGKSVERDDVTRFSENEINRLSKSIIKSYEFMNYLINH